MTITNPQHASIDGIKFIACREALATHAYIDGQHDDGTPKFSIGFGSQTLMPALGDVISIDDAFARLKIDINERELAVNASLAVVVSQSSFDALMSLYYQAGSDALAAVAAMFNNGPPAFAIAEFINWNFGSSRVPTEGHTKRRIREMIMALDDHYGDLTRLPFFEGNPREVPRQWMHFPEGM